MLSIDDHLMGACRIRFSENVGNFVFSLFQNLISLGTIHKCGETHSSLMGGDMASFNEVTELPKVQKLKALKDSGLFAKVRKSCQTSSFLIFFRLFSRFKCLL